MQIILFRKNVETKQEQTVTQESRVALTNLVLSLSAPDFIPPSCSYVCIPHLNPRFQVWETKPNDPWNIKQDPTKHSELSLASSQNVAEPQSITWFWVKTTLNHHFFLWFRFENRVSCKACPSFRRVPWQSTGKASASMDSVTLAASVSLRGGNFFSFCPSNIAQVLHSLNHMIIKMTENHKMYQ